MPLPTIHQLAVDIFLQQAGGQCLVRNPILQGAGLEVFQIPAGNANIQALVFLEGSAGSRAVGFKMPRGIFDTLQTA